MKSTTLLFGIAAALVFFGCGKEKNTQDEPAEVIAVRVQEILKTNIQTEIRVAGQFTTDDETLLSFKTGGVIKSVYVREGDRIQKGQLLAILDLTEIEAGLSQAKTALEKAVRDYARAEALFRDSVATLAQKQDAETGKKIAEQQYAAAQFNRNFSELRAARDGYVLRKFANEGTVVGPGMPVLQVNGGENGPWYLRVGLSGTEWDAVSVGDKASVETDAYPGKTLNASVARKSKGTDPYSGTFSADIKMQKQDEKTLASGLFGSALITPAARLEAWVVPYAALLDADRNTGFVFVTNDKKSVKKVQVHVAGLGKDGAYVTRGLEGYQYIVTGGSAYVTDGSMITVSESAGQ